ncbi:MAG: hypothetical protein IJO76_05815 [Clostridia bacterium]|nr:hypothetical protein [Clostridia bacterium]
MKEVTRLEAAQWIWCDQSEKVNQYAQFVQDFVCESTCATLYIAADTNYAAFINGQYVPGFAYSDYPECRSVDTLDLSPYLKAGNNRLCVVGYCQITDSLTYREGRPGVRFAVYAEDKPLALSSTATLSRRAPDYESGPMENITMQLSYTFHYHADGNDGWLKEGYTPDGTWHSAVPALTCASLRPRPLRQLTLEDRRPAAVLSYGSFTDCPDKADEPAGEQMQYAALSFRGRKSTDNGPLTLPNDEGMEFCVEDGDGLYIMLDLERETAGLLDFDIELKQDAKVYIGFGEHLDDLRVRTNVGGRQFCGVYHAKAGRQTFTHYYKRLGARYLQLHVYAPEIKLYYMGLRPVMYPLEYISDFDCGDLLMNKIYATAMDTLRLCMHEHYEDCPWREQGLYAMDSRVQMLCGYYAFKETAMPRESMRLLAQGMKETGLLELCAPSHFDMTIPSFSLAFICCVKDYVDQTGDTAFAAEMLPTIATILKTFLPQLTDSGLLTNFEGDAYWNFYEWNNEIDGWHYIDGVWQGPAPLGRYAPMQAMYILSAEDYLALCKLTETAPFSAELPAIIDGIRKASQAFWNAERQQFISCLDAPVKDCELVQAQFILAGIATEEQARLLREKLTAPAENGLTPITQSHCIYKYEALLSDPAAYGGYIRQDIANNWGGMLFKGATSFWETQRGPWDFSDAGSLCHGWATIPIYIFHKYADYVL